MSQCAGLLSALPLCWKSSYFPPNRAVHPDSLHSRQIAVLPFQLPVPSLQILWEPWSPTAFRNKDGHVEVSPYLSSRNPVLPTQERPLHPFPSGQASPTRPTSADDHQACIGHPPLAHSASQAPPEDDISYPACPARADSPNAGFPGLSSNSDERQFLPPPC